jgi:Ca2+-binding EF-hand superfamily protein
MRRGEFLAFMLIAMQKAKQEDVDQLRAIFDKLDKDNNQFLDKKDLQTLVRDITRNLYNMLQSCI